MMIRLFYLNMITAKKYENFSWSTKVNCLKEVSNNNLIYLFGNSFGEHLFPPLYSIPNINLIYSRFENEYLNEKSYSVSNFNHIVNQYTEISKQFENIIVIVSLNSRIYSTKKIKNLVNRINNKNTKIILLYPHPAITEFKDNEQLRKYNNIKKNNLKN